MSLKLLFPISQNTFGEAAKNSKKKIPDSIWVMFAALLPDMTVLPIWFQTENVNFNACYKTKYEDCVIFCLCNHIFALVVPCIFNSS